MTNQFRDVPMHPHLIEQGFLVFAKASATGPMVMERYGEPPVVRVGRRQRDEMVVETAVPRDIYQVIPISR
ncbi:hypothetical protein VSX64_16960 [Aurantimonas sp. C2-6-R+9]|uniref:hypothetical protein n=1 Tax=unclassified Aurantimonas TaxID=2638230 RepID=UPI002E17C0D6|nr:MULTISPECIES: hypothetical protein [unclassified Aurantimonas]MEC5292384.1 hypothetical protein [Aurantimonas sp. C2-3-R2]MEC5382538.1 hypothetical protein [Aurantimonas sp. C2-6-R+9]MEC5411831.1 hypothetical protein [Aurantimonas sp. C2-4-R8]